MLWEYDSFASKIDDPLELLSTLNLVGKDGWELVNINVVDRMVWAYVKRPLVS
jgi:hypothetical protein